VVFPDGSKLNSNALGSILPAGMAPPNLACGKAVF
jgi:hypothetical protein